jgi:hypothetical protein
MNKHDQLHCNEEEQFNFFHGLIFVVALYAVPGFILLVLPS